MNNGHLMEEYYPIEDGSYLDIYIDEDGDGGFDIIKPNVNTGDYQITQYRFKYGQWKSKEYFVLKGEC